MNHSKRNKSSYQVLKEDLNETYANLVKAKATIYRMQRALWKIAMMRGPEVTEAPRVALRGLNDETEEKKD